MSEQPAATHQPAGVWEFRIDVGGTFTDCIARSPDGDLHTLKLLSSGVTRGTADRGPDDGSLMDRARCGDPEGFWVGYRLQAVREGRTVYAGVVTRFDATHGVLHVNPPYPAESAGATCELSSHEPAPLVAIRYILGLRLDQVIPPVHLRLGTTRGTNALLTRTGANVGLATTAGFGDVLLIGNQDRPDLFRLNIQKPEPLFRHVIEIDERIDAAGSVLHAPDEDTIRHQLAGLQQSGVDSLAICLMNSYRNPTHEQIVARLARECGMQEISVSSSLSPLIKFVARGDTTVLDAYLNPILRDYLNQIERALPGSRVQLMTSSGGLVNADHFSGRDSLLSGPAGGVVGFSKAAQRAGFDRAIGFDMGGTSTDVARFDGSWTLDFETTKAGVRVATPTLSIETVAAGGGSVCHFDGVRLLVGPASAGADPGPACYGKGGPLTVTDLNLRLGRILPQHFPFELDPAAVERRLQELRQRVNHALGTRYTATELAEGLLEIANANMVRAIRRVSVARGFDPAEHLLVTFGGAGAQHACSMADALRIPRILIPRFAGILSAWGIGEAEVRTSRVASVLQPLTSVADLSRMFARLERDAMAELQDQGVVAATIRRSLDLRYRGVESTINVPEPDDANYASAYTAAHRRQFGYAREQWPIEVTAARVEAIAETADQGRRSTCPTATQPAASTDQTTTVIRGTPVTAQIFVRSQLRPGDVITGPAVVSDETSTILILPDWSATVMTGLELLLCRTTASPGAASDRSQPDPVRLEVLNNHFASIAEQMGETLRKTSVSTNVKERLDYSCAIFAPDGSLVVNAPHIPVHLGAMGETVRYVIRDNPDMQPGDVFVTNDPFRGGSHLPDVTVVTPVFDAETRQLSFFTASRAHHAEIGGIVPGSMPPFSTSLAEEGVLIRNFRLLSAGSSHEDELRQLLTSAPLPSRAVEDNLADVRAQVAANHLGAAQLNQLIAQEGRQQVQAGMQQIQQAAASKMRLALAELPDGTVAMTDCLDDGSPITASITIRGSAATVDFSGTGPVLKSNLNANRAIVTAAVLYVMRCLIAEDIPLNAGVLEPVSIELPTCLLNPPEHNDPAHCAAMVGGNVETSQRVVDVLLGALQLAAASQGTMNNLTFGDDTFGYYETICGGAGATPDAAGADAVHTHMTNTRLTDPEILEHRYPVRLDEFRIRTHSGGSGHHRGGDGVSRTLTFLRPLAVSMLSQRRGPYPPFGLNGGAPAAVGQNLLTRAATGTATDLGGSFSIHTQPLDRLTIHTPGGGGYGRVEPTTPDDSVDSPPRSARPARRPRDGISDDPDAP